MKYVFAFIILLFILQYIVLRFPKISVTKLVELSLWLVFLGSFVQQADSVGLKIRLIHYFCIYGGGMLLLLLSLRYFKHIKSYGKLNRGYFLLPPMLLISCMGVLLGIVGGGAPRLILNSFLCYAGSCLILLAAQWEIRQLIVTTFRRQLLCAIVFAIYAIFFSPAYSLNNRAEWLLSSAGTSFQLLGGVFFFVGFVMARKDRKNLLLTVSGYILYVIVSLKGLTRAPLILALVITPLAVMAVNWKFKSVFRQMTSWLKGVILVVFILTGVFYIWPSSISQLGIDNVLSNIMYRFTRLYEWQGISAMKLGLMDTLTHEAEYSRGAETVDFLGSTNLFEYVVGRGFGVKWYSLFWGQEWEIVHIGPLHLILQGGILLLVTYFLMLLFALKSSWRKVKRDPVAMGSFVYLTTWIFGFVSYGAFSPTYQIYFFWLIVGLALSTDKPIRQQVFMIPKPMDS